MPQSGTNDPSDSGNPPAKPAVIPRAHQLGGSSNLPIEQWILSFLNPPIPGVIQIVAPPGGGKTTALNYLRQVLSNFPSIHFFDTSQNQSAHPVAPSSLVIVMCDKLDPDRFALMSLQLCPWTIDDCIEYAATRHRDRASSIIPRLAADPSLQMLQGSPALIAAVIDQMALDPALDSARQAICRLLASLDIPPVLQGPLLVCCLERLGIGREVFKDTKAQPLSLASEPFHWFRHQAVQRLFLSQSIAQALSAGEIPGCLNSMAAQALLPDIALVLADYPGSAQTLAKLIVDTPENPAVPMAASILLQLDPNWRPPITAGHPLNLSGAILRGAKWAAIDLQHATLVDADFTQADLSAANLNHAAPLYAKFTEANLRQAQLSGSDCRGANFQYADLSGAIADHAKMDVADFTNATLTAAVLSFTSFSETILTGADICDARLDSTDLDRAIVDDADFTNADLTHARLRQLRMQTAIWHRCQFRSARILACNLEGLEIQNADFTLADLTSSLLTASRIPRARFTGAILAKTGLADIEWENADLSDADLTHASFHLGSSRSGLVGSTIPSEGSRTGFYTDEFYEQDYKSPEEIRKACLVGADLRGANLTNTDFYLVDLRNARFTVQQRRHLMRCGAILLSRAV